MLNEKAGYHQDFSCAKAYFSVL